MSLLTMKFSKRLSSKELMLGDTDELDIASYVPNRVIRYYEKLVAESKEPPVQEHMHKTSGILLVADISGFTALSKMLLETMGKDGPDLTSRYLNEYFHVMMCILQEYGGDVLKFAGDALLVFFDKTSENARQAIECALVLVARCNNYLLGQRDNERSNDRKHPDITLSLHCAVGAGDAVEMHIGGVGGRWEHCITGEFFGEVGDLVDASKAGQVAVAPNVMELLTPSDRGDFFFRALPTRVLSPKKAPSEDQAASPTSAADPQYVAPPPGAIVLFKEPKVAEMRASAISLKSHRFQRLLDERKTQATYLTPAVQTFLGRYVQPFVTGALSSGDSSMVAEMRHVSTIFCHLPPFQQVGLRVYQQVLTGLQLLLSINDGVLRQFITDDKGTVMIACFGLPGTSSLRRGKRALSTAFSLTVDMSQIVPIHVGVSSGMAFCGNVGSDSRCEYCMVGDAINMAARLMSIAKKRQVPVLCDEETHQSASTAFSFDQGEPTKVKGRTMPIKVYRVLSSMENEGQDSDSTKNARLVGRSAVMDFIWYTVATHRTANTVLYLSAAMGQGKSALIDCIARSAEAFGIQTFFAAAASSVASKNGGALEDGVLFDVLRQWLAILLNSSGGGKSNIITLRSMMSPKNFAKIGSLANIPNLLPDELAESILQLEAGHRLRILAGNDPNSEDESSEPIGEKDMLSDALDIVVDMFSRVARRQFPKALFIIDDVDYVDATSWEVIKRMFTKENNLSLIVTYGGRSSRQTDEWRNVTPAAIATATSLKKKEELQLPLDNCPIQIEYRLMPLTKGDTARLILQTIVDSSKDFTSNVEQLRECVESENEPEKTAEFIKFRDFVYTRSGGNPLFAIELVSFSVRQGVAIVKDSEFHLSISEGETLESLCSKSIGDVITSRLDHSSAGGRLLLKTASVIGSEFSLDMLEAMLGDHEKVALIPLYVRELVSRNFWRIMAPGHYEFTHKSVQEIIYAMLTVAQREEMHYNYANYLRNSGQGDPASLAFHYARSSYAVEAIDYILQHGQRLSYLGNNNECIMQMERGIKLVTDLQSMVDAEQPGRRPLVVGDATDKRVVVAVQIRMMTLLVQSRLTLSSGETKVAPEKRAEDLVDCIETLEKAVRLGTEHGVGPDIVCPAMSALFVCKSSQAASAGNSKKKRELLEVAVRFIELAERCEEKFHLLKALDAGSLLRIKDGDYKGTIDILGRAMAIYLANPGVGPRIVAHYGSDWGMWAMTKFLSQLLMQGRMVEFMKGRREWRKAASALKHAFTFQLVATAEANWYFLMDASKTFRQQIGRIDAECDRKKAKFPMHWTHKLLMCWAHEFKNNGVEIAEPHKEFRTFYENELPGRSWWIGSGVCLAAIWTAACCRSSSCSLRDALLALEAISGPHDADSGYFSPLLVALNCQANLMKAKFVTAGAGKAYAGEMQSALEATARDGLFGLRLRILKIICDCFPAVAQKHKSLAALLETARNERTTLKSKLKEGAGEDAATLLAEL